MASCAQFFHIVEGREPKFIGSELVEFVPSCCLARFEDITDYLLFSVVSGVLGQENAAIRCLAVPIPVKFCRSGFQLGLIWGRSHLWKLPVRHLIDGSALEPAGIGCLRSLAVL